MLLTSLTNLITSSFCKQNDDVIRLVKLIGLDFGFHIASNVWITYLSNVPGGSSAEQKCDGEYKIEPGVYSCLKTVPQSHQPDSKSETQKHYYCIMIYYPALEA